MRPNPPDLATVCCKVGTALRSRNTLSRMPGIDELVNDLERSYRETQERMSDPAVYNDHREAAEVGRRLKELEGPHRLAQEWQGTRDDLEAARGEPELRELVPETEH